jgi:TolB protein
MKTRLIFSLTGVLGAIAAGAFVLEGQQDLKLHAVAGEMPKIAVIDFRGAGEAQKLMDPFNKTLWDELAGSGALSMVAKSLYPLNVPQVPGDFKPPTTIDAVRRGDAPRVQNNGPWLTDWSNPPVKADYLAFGYTGAQGGQLVLYGWLYKLSQPDPASAQLIGKLYYGSLDADGAKKVAREFAADILRQFGAQSLAGSKIYFVSDRTGNMEIWSMDYDGSNQHAITQYHAVTDMPAISPDGKLLAFTTYALGNPKIMLYSTEAVKRVPFYNPVSSAVETPEFTPDGQHLLYAASLEGWVQICISDIDGGNMRRISHVRAIEVSPKVNPKNPTQVVFISGRGGSEQLWRMSIDGGDLAQLTDGTGYVSNPSWSPNGQFVAFAWTRGYEPGNYNIFVMDIAKRDPQQLTKGAGRNENPWWAPDGVHLVFSRKTGKTTQLFTMLADGNNVQQLTTQGNNTQAVWTKGLN